MILTQTPSGITDAVLQNGRIDVHAHYFPRAYRRALEQAGLAKAGGIPIPDWSPALAVDFMDRHGIAAQVVSVSDPGLW